MSRTDKWEHKTDSWHTNHRDERKARAAGRLLPVITWEMDSMDKRALDRHITGNYGEDQFTDADTFDEFPEVDPACPHCGLTQDKHREEIREDHRTGGDYEILACAPEGCREGAELDHWLENGCTDYDPTLERSNVTGVRYCWSCGNDISKEAAHG